MSAEPEQRKIDLGRAAPAGALGVIWAILPAVMGVVLLANISAASDWLSAHPTGGLFTYVSLFAIMAGCGLLPTYAQAILGGWVFGVAVGLPAALSGFVGGALIGYAVTRFVAGDRVENVIASNIKARAVRDALIGHGFWKTLGIVALIRVPPNSPFALTNLAMSSTGVSLGPYLLGTMIGMLPRTAVAVVLASLAADTDAPDIQAFVKESGFGLLLAGIAVLIVVAAIIGAIARHALKRVTAGATESGSDA